MAQVEQEAKEETPTRPCTLLLLHVMVGTLLLSRLHWPNATAWLLPLLLLPTEEEAAVVDLEAWVATMLQEDSIPTCRLPCRPITASNLDMAEVTLEARAVLEAITTITMPPGMVAAVVLVVVVVVATVAVIRTALAEETLHRRDALDQARMVVQADTTVARTREEATATTAATTTQDDPPHPTKAADLVHRADPEVLSVVEAAAIAVLVVEVAALQDPHQADMVVVVADPTILTNGKKKKKGGGRSIARTGVCLSRFRRILFAFFVDKTSLPRNLALQ
ncbi:MAG: hypothetical protein J3R72DRAFT_120401 [Linnemannia gamsii]|nr:MAG: hypothetical protein J3R72DRAFT_120401 [Linnemannia gamsii]